MVSYEEAIANLQQAYDMLRKADDNGVKMTNNMVCACRCAVKDALSFMEEPAHKGDKDMEVHGKWIGAKDKLPKEFGWYLVYAPGYYPGSSNRLRYVDGVMFAKWNTLGWSIETGYHRRPGCVAYWMPLPKAPKEEKTPK